MNTHQSTWKNNLLGTLEIALLLPKGASRFSSDSRNFKLSFLIPILLLPLTLITVFYAHPAGALPDEATKILTVIYTLRLFISLGLFLSFVYLVAKTLDKVNEFKKLATANNWLTLPAAVLMLPLLGLFMSGSHSWAEIYPMMVIVTLYSYAYTGFMIAKVMRVPYEFAAFMAIFGLMIHQTSLGALKWAAVQTINLIA